MEIRGRTCETMSYVPQKCCGCTLTLSHFKTCANIQKHHSHNYEELHEAFEKYKGEIVSSLGLMEKQLPIIERALAEHMFCPNGKRLWHTWFWSNNPFGVAAAGMGMHSGSPSEGGTCSLS